MKFKKFINELKWSNIENTYDKELKSLILSDEVILLKIKVKYIINKINKEELSYVDDKKVNKISNDIVLDPPLIKPRSNKKELMFLDGRHRTVNVYNKNPELEIPFYVFKEDIEDVKKILKIKR